MYVPPLAFISEFVCLALKPFDKISIYDVEPSELELFGTRATLPALYPSLAVSRTNHASATSVRLTITHLGLNPVYTNGPSVEPLPV